MRKKYICLCLIVSLLWFSACSPSESVSDATSIAHSISEELPLNILPFPEVAGLPTIDLGVDPQDKINEHIELNYKITSPDDGFFSVLENLNEESYKYLLDQKNYLKIGGYTLFYNNFSFVGPSKIYIDAPNGDTLEVFSSTQPIWEMSFSP
jgi:hypothetical protein